MADGWQLLTWAEGEVVEGSGLRMQAEHRQERVSVSGRRRTRQIPR